MTRTRLAPGATIGILGGGQLGRMTALAAARLGYRTHVFTDEPDGPGAQVTSRTTVATLDDEGALDRFAGACDVVTYETENIPLAAAERIARTTPVLPAPAVLAVTQHRLKEKDFLRSIGVPTTEYRDIPDQSALPAALAELGGKAVLKTVRMGYDGKGQSLFTVDSDPAEAWAKVGGGPAIVEAFVPFRAEASVIVARGADGAMATYPLVENRHVDHILATTIAPARLPTRLADEADDLARRIARTLDLVGVLAVELFVTVDDRLMVNELAPRPHNSGHWTIDASATSQFEQLVRTLAGLPLGPTTMFASAVMTNLIGDAVHDWADYLADPADRLHLYGKTEARAGRKMGHVTRLVERPSPKPLPEGEGFDESSPSGRGQGEG